MATIASCRASAAGVALDLHGHDGREAQPDAVALQDGTVGIDLALALQPLDPAQARRGRLIRFEPVSGLIKDCGSLIRAHIDLLMMALFCVALIGLARKAYRVASFATTTVGFAWAACSILQAL